MKFHPIKLFLALLPGLILLNNINTVTEAAELYDVPIIILEEPEVFIPQETSESVQILTASVTVESTVYEIPKYPGMKKWLDYRCFRGNTKQARLQQYAITDASGLRQVDGCYCIAVGSRFNTEIGQRLDLVLENGTVIPCVMGDQKANVHTDATNTFSNTTKNLCCSEFIVSTRNLKHEASQKGDASFVMDIWNSPVSKIITYNINILEEIENDKYPTENIPNPNS